MASEKAALAKAQESAAAPVSQDLPPEAYPASDNHDMPPPPPPTSAPAHMPTVDDPFNFPTEEEALPAYSAYASDPQVSPDDAAGPASSSSASASAPSGPPPGHPRKGLSMKPIAIPQIVPDASSPFVSAYPPSLLASGITEQSWMSFLDTVSAFLTAKVGERAVSHAGDMAKHFAEDTTNLGKDIANRGKHLGKDIARHAKRGNIVGVAATLISGTVTLPIMAALGLAGTATRLPGAAVGAIVKKPKTPAERVNAYTVVANQKWLHARGLHAQLVDTPGLSHLLQLPVEQLLAIARSGKEGSAAGMLQALNMHIESLKVAGETTLGLSDKSLWLVLVEFDPKEAEEQLARQKEEEEQRYMSRRELERQARGRR